MVHALAFASFALAAVVVVVGAKALDDRDRALRPRVRRSSEPDAPVSGEVGLPD